MTRDSCIPRLLDSGITWEDAHALRRISMTLHRWHEYECGTGTGQTTYSIERDGDEPFSPPFMRVQYPTRGDYVDIRNPIRDLERGALKRLGKIMAKYPTLQPYVQGDPRGCALYIVRPDDIRDGQALDACYTRGIAVYK